jgi:glycosyltransferase involved in cell wall biosynthesis
LGVIDLSAGPSGLSRYVELLWPALCKSFDVSVFGNPQGPYATMDASFIGVAERVDAESSHLQSGSETKKAAVARQLWRTCAPKSVRWIVGFKRDAQRLAPVISAQQIDVCYVSICDAEATVSAARLAGVRRVVGTLHLPPPGFDRPVKRSFARSMLGMVDKAIAVSDQIAEDWRQLGRKFDSKIVTIRNGVAVSDDTGHFKSRDRLVHPCTSDGAVSTWLAAGRLAEQKGFGYLIDAVSCVCKRHPTFRLAIAGQGPLEATLRQQVERLGLTDNVLFLGHVADMQPLYATCGGFVLSSVNEAMPFALLEAMATGAPSVATAVGGVPDLISNGENGLLVPPRQPAQLANAINQFLVNRQFAEQCGAIGRATVRQQFSIDHMRRETLHVLSEGL